MSPYSRFAAAYALAVFVAFASLLAVGERRLDVYVSIYILEYFVLSAVLGVRLSWLLSLALMAVFLAIVAYRVSMILAGL